jgi:hypothetical protein
LEFQKVEDDQEDNNPVASLQQTLNNSTDPYQKEEKESNLIIQKNISKAKLVDITR